ncbi:restriction endonuclease subunit S, partial [Brachyspira catarrhinii]
MGKNEKEWQEVRLGDIVKYYNNKISRSLVTNYNYISTENLLPNIGGKINASSIPNTDKLNSYLKNHILISNIRPYFKKIWFARNDGGCSSDILVFESTNNNTYPKYLYYLMSQNIFFDYVMTGANGTKMPRGDKKHILNFTFLLPPLEEQKKIASILSSLD